MLSLGEVSGLLRTLSLFHHEAEALELQKLFDNLLTLVEKSIPLIWPEESDEPENMLPVSKNLPLSFFKLVQCSQMFPA